MPTGSKPPNVVLVTADHLKQDYLGCYGHPDAITPHLDRLADQGVRFTSTYVSSPICSPSRFSIYTGKHPHVAYKETPDLNKIRLNGQHATSFPRLLHAAGYRTCHIGHWRLGPFPDYFDADLEMSHHIKGRRKGHYWLDRELSGEAMDFAQVKMWHELPARWFVPTNARRAIPDFGDDDPGVYSTDEETDAAIRFLGDAPFCLVLNYHAPHPPWTAPLESCLRFKDKVAYPTYHAMVNRVDENLGRLFAALKRNGLWDDTIILFTSDHGHNFRQRWNEGRDDGKRLCFDQASKVALIASWNGHIQPRVEPAVVSNVDLAPTILELCGLPIPDEMHGRSLAHWLLNGEPMQRPTAAFIQNTPDRSIPEISERCIVTDEWKLIINSHGVPAFIAVPEGAPSVQLFARNGDDPDEEEDLMIYDRPPYHDDRVASAVDHLIGEMERWATRVADEQALELIERARRFADADATVGRLKSFWSDEFTWNPSVPKVTPPPE